MLIHQIQKLQYYLRIRRIHLFVQVLVPVSLVLVMEFLVKLLVLVSLVFVLGFLVIKWML